MKDLPTILEEDIEKALEELSREESPNWLKNHPIAKDLGPKNRSLGVLLTYAILRHAAKREDQSFLIIYKGINRLKNLSLEMNLQKCKGALDVFLNGPKFANLRSWINNNYQKEEERAELTAGALRAYLLFLLDSEE